MRSPHRNLRLFALVSSVVLVACTQMPPEPVTARLSQSALTVEMSNGSSCRADLLGDAPWRGDLAECGLDYVVTPTAGQSPIRLAFDAMIAALRAGDLVAPMADILLTERSGKTHAFASPVVDEN